MTSTRALSGILAATLLLGAAPVARADIPRVINFQGRMSDASGTPLSGPHAVTFRILDAATLGTACFTETQPALPVNNGLFKANVGTATAGGIGGCDFSVPYYLEVQVDTDGPMTPRLILTAAAYAFSADLLDGKDSSQFYPRDPATGNVSVTGSVGVGTASPSQRVDAVGYVKATELCIGTACKAAWPNSGTVTSVAAGTGITLSPSPVTSAGTVSVNSSVVQLRVSGACPANQVVKTIAADGTVTCSTLASGVTCLWSGRIYSPGSKCYASGTYLMKICQTDGTWATYTETSMTSYPTC